MKKVLLAIALVLFAAGGYFFYALAGAKDQAVAVVTAILQTAPEGGDAYLSAQMNADQRRTLARVRVGAERLLGKFVRVDDVTSWKVNKGTSGSRAELSLALAFDKHQVPGEFVLVEEKGKWRVLSFYLTFDEKLQTPPNMVTLDKRSRELVPLFATDEATLVASFPQEIKDGWKEKQVSAPYAKFREQCGAFGGFEPTHQVEDGDANLQRVTAIVPCANGGSARITLRWRWDWLEETWELVGFDFAPEKT